MGMGAADRSVKNPHASHISSHPFAKIAKRQTTDRDSFSKPRENIHDIDPK
jgi:hypothetical protein